MAKTKAKTGISSRALAVRQAGELAIEQRREQVLALRLAGLSMRQIANPLLLPYDPTEED